MDGKKNGFSFIDSALKGKHQKAPNHYVYPSNVCLEQPQTRDIVWKPKPSLCTLKSVSMTSLETKSFGRERGDNLVTKNKQNKNLVHSRHSKNKDSFTQTSKTIIELARMDNGSYTPDSLTQSPRNEYFANNLYKVKQLDLNQQFNLQNGVVYKGVESSLADSDHASTPYTLEGSVCEFNNSLAYSRKSDIIQYLHHCTEYRKNNDGTKANTFPDTSLMETFLAKKQSEIDTLYTNPHLHNTASSSVGSSRARFLQQASPMRNLTMENCNVSFKSQSFIEPPLPNLIAEERKFSKVQPNIRRFTVKSVRKSRPPKRAMAVNCYTLPTKDVRNSQHKDRSTNVTEMVPSLQKTRNNSFMSPTFASEQRNRLHEIRHTTQLISPTHRGKSNSPRSGSPLGNIVEKIDKTKVPYIDQSESESVESKTLAMQEGKMGTKRNEDINRRPFPLRNLLKPVVTKPVFDEDLLKIDQLSLVIKSSEETLCSRINELTSVSSMDNIIALVMSRIRDPEWSAALRGLAEMTELCRSMDTDILYAHMTSVNQRMLELMRSPRSHVARTACQAAGHFFDSMKDTRRPEFDDIVDLLLSKTADANKFIRKDANLALDCMVTHIPTFHAVRSLCSKGPSHKNQLVRTATVRLLVCAVVIAGPDIILGSSSNEFTRKRIIQHMLKFLQDKSFETRKYGERLYKVLCKCVNFDIFLKRYAEKDEITRMKKTLKLLQQKR